MVRRKEKGRGVFGQSLLRNWVLFERGRASGAEPWGSFLFSPEGVLKKSGEGAKSDFV